MWTSGVLQAEYQCERHNLVLCVVSNELVFDSKYKPLHLQILQYTPGPSQHYGQYPSSWLLTKMKIEGRPTKGVSWLDVSSHSLRWKCPNYTAWDWNINRLQQQVIKHREGHLHNSSSVKNGQEPGTLFWLKVVGFNFMSQVKLN